jgi:3-deoxy-D-manno-octulosonic-acid transferase
MAGARLADATLALYRGCARLGTPLISLYLDRRRSRGREDPTRFGERWGHAGERRPSGPLLWLHAASVGELISGLPVITALGRQRPALRLLVTSGTVTSARLAGQRLPPGVIHQFVPIDHPAAVERFLDHWRPDAGLFLESEFWPTLVTAAEDRGIELALLNGRMSRASFANWRRLGWLARRLLSCFSLVLAQAEADRQRFAALGAKRVLSLGNLKNAAAPLPADPVDLQALRTALAGRSCWLAASTHPGEEEILAAAQGRLATSAEAPLLILVPRHPERGAELERMLSAAGRGVARRSSGANPGPDLDIYLADTLGELGLWYRLAEIAFVGGSLIPHGGQNLLEAARLDCAVLAGPHTENFAEIAEALSAAGALARVADDEDLAGTVAALLAEPQRRQAMAAAAAGCARSQDEIVERVLEALAPLLDRTEAGKTEER